MQVAIQTSLVAGWGVREGYGSLPSGLNQVLLGLLFSLFRDCFTSWIELSTSGLISVSAAIESVRWVPLTASCFFVYTKLLQAGVSGLSASVMADLGPAVSVIRVAIRWQVILDNLARRRCSWLRAGSGSRVGVGGEEDSASKSSARQQVHGRTPGPDVIVRADPVGFSHSYRDF